MGARLRYLLKTSPVVLGSVLVMGFMIAAVIVGPLLASHSMQASDWDRIDMAPDFASHFYFGTDGNGRDLFVRTLVGGRISLLVALAASLVSLIIGVTYGATAGYLGGRVDNTMMRIVDILYSLPFTFFVILLTVFFGRSLILIFVAIGAIEWLTMARVVRGQTLALKQREFVEAARAFGASDLRILVRHILPNLWGPVIACLMLVIPEATLTESFLSFLGLGVQEPMTSWGVLIGDGAQNLVSAPWSLFIPGGFLAVTLLALGFIGDAVRDILDPRSST